LDAFCRADAGLTTLTSSSIDWLYFEAGVETDECDEEGEGCTLAVGFECDANGVLACFLGFSSGMTFFSIVFG